MTEAPQSQQGPNHRSRGATPRGLLFVAILVAAAALVLFLGSRVYDRMTVLRAAPQDNVQWSLAQLDVELLATGIAARDAASNEDADLTEVRRRFDVFYSRVNTIAALPLFRDHGLSDPSENGLIQLKLMLQKAALLIDAPDAELRIQLPQIVAEFDDARPIARQITLEGVKKYAAEADRSRADLAWLLQQTALVSACLILALAAALLFLFRQIRISRRHVIETEAASARNASTVNASLDAIIVMDMNGRIVEFNPAAVQTFGFSRNAAVGAILADLIVPRHHREAHQLGLERLRSTGKQKVVGAGRVEMTALRSDGAEFPIEMSLALSDSVDGQVVTAFMRDISQRLSQESELRRARDEALQAAHAKSQFLAVMSHEMRTPLNGVMALLDLLGETKLNRKQQTYLSTAATSAEVLKQHVDDVLDLTRFQAGKIELQPSLFNLVELLKEVQGLNLAMAAKRGNHLELIVDMPEPYFVGDRKRLHQILTNLISNAIKFTENGRIQVSAKFTGVQADKVNLRFEVQDTGIGISAENQLRVFEEFVTLDSSLQRNASGTGLGLPICRQIVSSMGGSIGVNSEFGHGSLFWFEVPMKAAFAEKAGAKKIPAAGKLEFKKLKLKVLVVEDNETNRFVSRELLHSLGCLVTLANDGAQGAKLARAERFDLILMDISMPIMNGWDAARAIRLGSGKSQNARIIALTAHALPDAQSLLQDSGMDGILIKPLRRDELKLALGAQTKSGVAAEKAKHEEGLDIDRALVSEMVDVLGGKLVFERFKAFSSEMSSGIQHLHDLLKRRDVDGFKRAAHKLAGSASVFGAVELHKRLVSLETAREPDFRIFKSANLEKVLKLTVDQLSQFLNHVPRN